MTTAHPKALGELRLSGKEFDRIMRNALAVHPPKRKKQERKPTNKKARKRK